jgi:hypothetical protein
VNQTAQNTRACICGQPTLRQRTGRTRYANNLFLFIIWFVIAEYREEEK